MQKYQDIAEEYERAMRIGVIPENGVKSAGWTAKAISDKMPHLPINIVYEFMVGLRDDPVKYLEYVVEGAPVL